MDENTKFQGNSVALWASGFTGDIDTEVHINFWHFIKCDNHLEIGIELPLDALTSSSPRELFIYLPFRLNRHSHIIDLGDKFATKNVATKIFNKNLRIGFDSSPLITLTSEDIGHIKLAYLV